jgi:hypothetical protein
VHEIELAEARLPGMMSQVSSFILTRIALQGTTGIVILAKRVPIILMERLYVIYCRASGGTTNVTGIDWYRHAGLRGIVIWLNRQN